MLFSRRDTEHLGLVCARCQCVTVRLHAWRQCGHCGELLLKLEPSDCQPRRLYVNWETGTKPLSSGLSPSTPIVAIPFGRGRGVPRALLGPGQVVHTRTTVCQTRKTCVSEVQCTQLVGARPWPQDAPVAVAAAESPALKRAEGARWIQRLGSSSSSGEEEPGIINVGSPRFECRFGVLGEGIGEWGSEVQTEWSWGTEERKSPPCPSLYSEETEAAVIHMKCARNFGFCEAYATRVPDLSPPRTYAQA